MRTSLRSKRDSGFTLVEVLVSLVIFSVAILGLTQAGTQKVSTFSQIEQRTYASIVADNQLALARLQKDNPFARALTGESEAGGRVFEFSVIRVETEIPDFFELVVRVSAQGSEQVLVERRAFAAGTSQ
jgi:general secretion pathway protein I